MSESELDMHSSHGELKRHLAELIEADPSRYSRGIGVERHKNPTVREIDAVLETLGLDFLVDESAQAKKDTLMLRGGRDHRTGIRYWDTGDLLAVIEQVEDATMQVAVDGNGRELDTDSDREAVTDGGIAEPRYPHLAGRLEQTRDRLRRTRRLVRENRVNEDLHEAVTDALAATDAALSIARGDDDALTSQYEEGRS